MPDKAGDRFTDKKGRGYELRPDPKGGHLRPITLEGPNNKNPLPTMKGPKNPLAAPLAAIMAMAVWEGLRWIWNKITKRKKQNYRPNRRRKIKK
jgi:hypothetical protein